MPPHLPITRLGAPGRFTYRRGGRPISRSDRDRVAALVLPPAWKNVRIAGSAAAKLQAIGTDAAGRRQYRYSESFRQHQDAVKFSRMPDFARVLPRILRRCKRDLRSPGLPRDKVLAAVVLVLDSTLIRIGSDEYARANGSFGLTTLQDRHVRHARGQAIFDFKAKSGIRQTIDLKDPSLARVVKACKDLPGSQLFQYRGQDGVVHDIKAADVNEYLRSVSGQEITAKDFRTWAGTALACAILRKCGKCSSATSGKRRIAQVVREVARHLGNTPAVCRKSYIAPQVLDAFIAGTLHAWQGPAGRAGKLSQGEQRNLLDLLAGPGRKRPLRNIRAAR